MKMVKASTTTFVIPKDGTALDDLRFCRALLCILAKSVPTRALEFSQEDFDGAVGVFLVEGQNLSNHNFVIKAMTREEIEAMEHLVQ